MRGPKNTATIAQKKLNPNTTKKTKVDKSTAKKDKATSKDSGAPKRPPSAFFVFMEEFRKDYKENFPDNKSVSVEKAPYVAIAEAKKADYGIAMKQHIDDLIEKEKSASTSKSSSETNDDGEQEATS
ncbi:hypothetical protein L1987_31714 [Smallanthus sonchifolius]|uniref:Uncharacterized protein n=1 Tax=Smallanthus sonchifolius TaxID=185202 RepID=A0ACB9I5P6_9ASTR|nr:hypothetical protein L1987_31714 [Smallanthus sonchifolius]